MGTIFPVGRIIWNIICPYNPFPSTYPRIPPYKPPKSRIVISRPKVDQPRLPIVIPAREAHKVPEITRTIGKRFIRVHYPQATVRIAC